MLSVKRCGVPAFLNRAAACQRLLQSSNVQFRARASLRYEDSDEESGQGKRKTRCVWPQCTCTQQYLLWLLIEVYIFRIFMSVKIIRLLGECRTHLPLSLFTRVKNMPPEGFTLTDVERSCDRNEVFCRTPLHVWELKCPKCLGSGSVAVDRRKKKSRILSVCPQCSGLGHVRYISSDLDGANSIPYYLLRNID